MCDKVTDEIAGVPLFGPLEYVDVKSNRHAQIKRNLHVSTYSFKNASIVSRASLISNLNIQLSVSVRQTCVVQHSAHARVTTVSH